MNTIRLSCLIAALLASIAPFTAKADDVTTSTNSAEATKRQELREKWQKMTPQERQEFKEKHPEMAKRLGDQTEDRREFFRRLGLKPEEMKDLTPQERQAKVKAAAEKKMAELTKKKESGVPLTEEEEKDFNTLQKMKDRRADAKKSADGK